ncbi:MAG TPA: S49 family peptidase [Candidatus Dojkabacteria bacterium]|nr:S49 family peptidase [Candidatus Dojkabacteria bacterium]HQF36437.1 S49 family peptidase [Candidatus Dojkabacteria bacterium]
MTDQINTSVVGSGKVSKNSTGQTIPVKKKRGWCLVVSILLVFIIICGMCSFFSIWFLSAVSKGSALNYETVYGDENSKNKILSIKIDGTILNEAPDAASFWVDDTYIYGYSIRDVIINASDDSSIKGIILEISSPGGTITGTKTIADAIEYYKDKTGNPVVAYGQGTVASGGYWLACSADYFVLDYGSNVGNIGVIFGPFAYYDVVLAEDGGILGGGVITQNGIEYNYITAGQYKDIGSPYRVMSETEVQSLQKGVDNEYNEFVKQVSEGRGIEELEIKSNIKALIYDNLEAERLNLIDESGNKYVAYQKIAEMASLGDDFQIIRDSSASGVIGSFWGMLGNNYDVNKNWYEGKYLVYWGGF